MPRINALNILLESDGKEYLAELYGKTIEGVQKALISGSMKNMDLSGDPVSGTVEAKRFVNATPKNYGTARTAGKGDAVKAKPVTVAIDTDREIVEELEQKDVRLYGVVGVLNRRSANHILRMAAELDNAFFAAAAGKATVLNLSAYKTISDELEAIIQECETTQNDFVDGGVDCPNCGEHLEFDLEDEDEPDGEEEQLALIVQQMAKAQGINEELKERDQMAWVGAMNNIQSAAREIMRSRYE